MSGMTVSNKTTLKSPSPSASAAKDLDLVGTYQVFLSFRGKDTRYGFTDYLYHDLVGAGVRTFRDRDELPVGEGIGHELLKAVKDSKISIPIFSKNYANSTKCLRQLAQMVECWENGVQKIIPIFYDVKPSEVKDYKSGRYNEAFVKYESDRSLDQKNVEQWKKALAIVGYSKGLELQEETNGYEGALVNIAVLKVLSKLKKNNMLLPNTLVGMDQHIGTLKGMLSSTGSNGGVQVIGIRGMSGIGKTTIAKAIYNELNGLFDSHCFLEDVGGKSLREGGLLSLQKQLILKILNREIPEFHDVDEGASIIKDAIHRRKVFIVLDNVNAKFQIEKLAVNHDWYLCGAGSRIIITTTNKEILLASEVTSDYEAKLMGENDALNLFCKHAFKRDSPPKGYHGLAKDIVSKAGGLPIVLVTLGSLLYIEKDKASWEAKFEKLKAIPRVEVLERLSISYDALDDQQKQIFLDIACFFAGLHKENPSYMWDDCGFFPSEGIKALVRRSLLTIREEEEDKNILRMHDQLIELGRNIVKQNLADPGDRSRLWDNSEGLETLKKHPGLANVEALRLDLRGPRYFFSHRLSGQDFAKLPKVRYLSLNGAELSGDFKDLHSKLRWLEWHNCSGRSSPINLYLKNLIILDMSGSKITDNWQCWNQIKMARKLKVLDLSRCGYLQSVPHLSNFASLESLQLSDCMGLRRLDGLEQLVMLSYLNTSWCRDLEKLSDLSKLAKLRTLQVHHCTKLTAIQGLEKLESLELLDISSCGSLVRLPDLSNLQKLTSFSAVNCGS